MIKKCLGILALSITSSAFAADFSYNYVELNAGQIETDFDGIELDADTLAVNVSVAVADNGYLNFGYDKSGYDFDIDFSLTTIGFGAYKNLGDSVSVYAEINAAELAVDFPIDLPLPDQEMGFTFGGGLRYAATDSIELEASLNRVDISDYETTTLSLGGRFHATENLSAGLTLTTEEDTTGGFLSARYSF